ncbi:MAG: hypothetical protein KDK78_01165, partial [Chlamydiia bacterium]|nr:hypothetical protein [Chlamydiia bacterium]
RSLFFEALQRRLEAPELTLWISSLALTEWQAFREALSDRAIEEWERRVAALPEDIPLFEREAVWAKASIIITNTLKDASGLQDESLEAIKSYELHLEKQLDSYCRSLPEKMGLLGHLKNFTNVQWTKLAGFTPRSDLACILEFLPQDIRARMLQPLPAQQKQDVAELVRFHEDKRQKELRAFGEAIQALKHWAASIDKVVHLAVEYEE